jgi:hypothetical protein
MVLAFLTHVSATYRVQEIHLTRGVVLSPVLINGQRRCCVPGVYS